MKKLIFAFISIIMLTCCEQENISPDKNLNNDSTMELKAIFKNNTSKPLKADISFEVSQKKELNFPPYIAYELLDSYYENQNINSGSQKEIIFNISKTDKLKIFGAFSNFDFYNGTPENFKNDGLEILFFSNDNLEYRLHITKDASYFYEDGSLVKSETDVLKKKSVEFFIN